MGSSAEENDGVRVRGEQCVYSSGAHCICRRMMRMCALEHVCVCVRARTRVRLCANVCEYLRGFVVFLLCVYVGNRVFARAHERASVWVFVNMCEVSWFVGV